MAITSETLRQLCPTTFERGTAHGTKPEAVGANTARGKSSSFCTYRLSVLLRFETHNFIEPILVDFNLPLR
jgi:hypothetical protein